MGDFETATTSIGVSAACRRLHHPISWRPVLSGTGDRVEVCRLCSDAYRLAVEQLGSDDLAMRFVKFLRDETRPWDAPEP